MTPRQTFLALALCTIAGASFAQPTSPTGTPGMGTSPPSATGTPLTTPTAPVTSSGTIGTSQHVPSRTDTADDAYRALDTQHRGYLTREEVQDVQGFSFEAADTDKDGRLSRDEFARAWGSRYDNSPYGK